MKQLIVKMLALACYYCGADGFFYWLNRKSKRIVTFHNVLPDELFRPGLANGVSNRHSDFKLIVEECAKRYKFSTDLHDVTTLTITFDDGYRNQYTTAFKTLQKMGIPAYLFVSGDVARGDGLLIDKLLHWVAEAPIELIPNGNRRRYWCEVVRPALMNDGKAKGESVFKDLDAKYPYSKIIASLPQEYLRERMGKIGEEELAEMRLAGWRIGWHTKSHYPLSRLTEEEVRKELDSPPEFRSACLSYPYGNPCEVGDMAVKIAEELGYPCAVSNTNAAKYCRYFLPRMSLTSDRYMLHFELSGCKYFLQHLKLLPKGDAS